MPVAQHGLPTGQRRQRSGVGPKNPWPQPDGAYIGKFMQRVKLRLIKSTLGAGQDRPGPTGAIFPQKIIDRRGLPDLGAKQNTAFGGP